MSGFSVEGDSAAFIGFICFFTHACSRYAQRGNQIENRLEVLNKCRGEGSTNPCLQKITPPGELKAGIDILKKVADGSISPSVADANLASLGMTREVVANKLGDFLDKIYRMPVAP